MYFPPNLFSCIIKLQFRIFNLVILVFNSEFLSFGIQKFLPNSLFDFSANPNPNRVIFDFIYSFLSSLSKSIKIVISQFIIRFDRISKDLSKFSYFSVELTLIHYYTP